LHLLAGWGSGLLYCRIETAGWNEENDIGRLTLEYQKSEIAREIGNFRLLFLHSNPTNECIYIHTRTDRGHHHEVTAFKVLVFHLSPENQIEKRRYGSY